MAENLVLAQFLEFLPFSLGGKVLGDFEKLGLRFFSSESSSENHVSKLKVNI